MAKAAPAVSGFEHIDATRRAIIGSLVEKAGKSIADGCGKPEPGTYGEEAIVIHVGGELMVEADGETTSVTVSLEDIVAACLENMPELSGKVTAADFVERGLKFVKQAQRSKSGREGLEKLAKFIKAEVKEQATSRGFTETKPKAGARKCDPVVQLVSIA